MSTLFKTYDIFDIEDEDMRNYCLLCCRTIALQCGLMCKCHLDGINTRLYMLGTKQQFVKYYLKTLLMDNKSIFDGLKRLVSCITW